MKKLIILIPFMLIVKNYGNTIINPIDIKETIHDDFKGESFDLLYQTVWIESRGESIEGQRQVTEVILNRVASVLFPNTIDSVVLQPYQFAIDTTVVVPDRFKKRIYKFIVNHKPNNYLYFLNPKTATNRQMLRLSKNGKLIGNHIFF